jgi:hypothetical protein
MMKSGSVRVSPIPPPRLAKLSNRIDATMQSKILGQMHARIPMVTADEQRALQLANAKEDVRVSSAMQDIHAGQVEDHKGIIAACERAVRDGEAAAAQAGEHKQATQERVAKIERGEDILGGLDRPKAMLFTEGLTKGTFATCSNGRPRRGRD